MIRRTFNHLLLGAGAARLLQGRPSADASTSAAAGDIDTTFAEPPASALPHTYWMWMNGNVTKEGITLDLEAMHRGGIGGFFIYNNAVGIPRGPIDYASEAWYDMISHAVKEANRLGLQAYMHNAPGYSGTGGPWMTPEFSMQELVWTETLVDARGPVRVELPRPQARRNYYRDAFVLAYPSLAVETGLMRDRVLNASVNDRAVDKTALWDGNRRNQVRIEPGPSGQPGALLIEFDAAFQARAITMYRSPEDPRDPYDGPRDYPPAITLQVSGDGANFTDVCRVRMPALRSMNSPGVQSFAAVSGRYFRIVAAGPTWITGVELHAGPRLPDWAAKANAAPAGQAAGSRLVEDPGLVIDPRTVRDITGSMDETGALQWDAPAGRWTILRMGHTTTEEEVAAAPDSGRGLECDKFRKEAVDLHFTAHLDKLFARLGRLVGTTFAGLLIDSWEAGKQNWTIRFPEEFRSRRQYDLVPYLPAMTGRIVGSAAESEKFLFDVRRTHAELLAVNYYGHFQTRCRERGLRLAAEPYGDGTFESLQVAEHLDLTAGEFWVRYTYGAKSYVDLAASASHALGQKIAGAEAFTGAPLTSRWTEYPYALKAEGDWMYSLGVNRLIFHTFVHQPHPTAGPGMTMGPFGTHFDRNSTWIEKQSGWTRYLSRVQAILQEGGPVTDVCWLKSEEPTSGVPDVRSGMLAVPAGFAADVISADTLLSRLRVENGRIAIGDYASYRCMVVPAMRTLSAPIMRKLRDLVAAGMWLAMESQPEGAPGLTGQPQADADVRQLAHELWGEVDGAGVKERQFGSGMLLVGLPLREVFDQMKLAPDFEYSAQQQDAAIHFVHRRINGAEFYFVANQLRRRERLVCTFRVDGLRPELWDAERGQIQFAAIYERVPGRMKVAFELEPSGSVFVVFRSPCGEVKPLSVSREGILLAGARVFDKPAAAPYAGVVNDFTLLMWAQPDTYAAANRSFPIFPREGGSDYVTAGVSAGQNGVTVWERGRGPARPVLEVKEPLEGWKHVAVAYRGGWPSVYIDGVRRGSGPKSAYPVHPGLHAPAAEEQFMKYFEGNMTAPELIREALSESEIRARFLAGLPDPELPSPIELASDAAGRLTARVWQPGRYQITGGSRTAALEVTEALTPVVIDGEWQVQFPPGSGAPPELALPSLLSLHKHPDFNVRHFSGTAVYRKTIQVGADAAGGARRLFLDLGRVDVMAQVKINSQDLGLLWKPPYRVDVSRWVHPGRNGLEIAVTNLWPNRLIGDEHLPAENEYDPHGPIVRLPDWYRDGKPKPAGRVTFSVWHHYRQNDPLLASGLSGPVRLLPAIESRIA